MDTLHIKKDIKGCIHLQEDHNMCDFWVGKKFMCLVFFLIITPAWLFLKSCDGHNTQTKKSFIPVDSNTFLEHRKGYCDFLLSLLYLVYPLLPSLTADKTHVVHSVCVKTCSAGSFCGVRNAFTIIGTDAIWCGCV